MTLSEANLKYKHVAHIVVNEHCQYCVYQLLDYGESTLHAVFGTLAEAIEACRYLDNAEPADRQI